MFKLNQKGMTLVETMVAAGLLGGLAVAGMTLFKTQNKAQQNVEQNYEMTATLSAIRGILSDLASCSATLGGRVPNGADVPSIIKVVNGVNSTAYTASTTARLPGTPLKLTRMRTNNVMPGITLGSNETMLQLFFSRGENAQTTTQVAKNVRINYTLSGANIQSCYAVTAGASDSLWQIEGTGPDIYYPVGNVGINTSTPDLPLHVSGTVAGGLFNAALFGNTGGTVGSSSRIYLSGDGSISRATYIEGLNTEVASANEHALAIGTSGPGAAPVERMRIDHLGRVGIGTNAPGNPLHVNGGLTDTVGRFESGDNIARLSVADNSETAFFSVNGGSAFLNLGFQADMSNGLYVRSNGNVGVGTNAPSQALEVRGNGMFRGTATSHHATIGEAGASAALGFGTGYLGFNAFRTAATSTWQFSGDGANNGGVSVYGTMNGIMRFVTTPSSGGGNQTLTDAQVAANTRMVINAAGDVGVGTVSPQARLDVRAIGSNAQIKFGRAGTSIGEGHIGANNNHAFLVHGQDLATQQNLVTVTQTGNVGIGGSSSTILGIYDRDPVQLLMRHDIGGNTDPVIFTVDESVQNAVQFWISPGDDFDVGSTTDKFHIGDYATSVARFTVQGNGWTGINQPNPTQMLHVNGGSVLASGYLYSSDKRLKEEIQDLTNPLERILRLKGHLFKWKESGKRDMGFVAQEVKKVEPTLVEGEGDDFLSVKYGNITALLVEAIKELKGMLSDLFKGQDSLEKEMMDLRKQNEELRQRIADQEKLFKSQEERLSKLEKGLEK